MEMAHVASHMLCAARTSGAASPEKGITLFIVDSKTSGISCEVMPTIAADKLCEVRFKDVAVPRRTYLVSWTRDGPLRI